MNPVEKCLVYLQNRNWIELTKVLSYKKSAKEWAESPTFSLFENVFIDERKRCESETNQDQVTVASRIFQLHQHINSTFTLSETTLKKIARFLFNKDHNRKYAEILDTDSYAQLFLQNEEKENQEKIGIIRLSRNLKVKVGTHGELQFDKEIFISPQERELYRAANIRFAAIWA